MRRYAIAGFESMSNRVCGAERLNEVLWPQLSSSCTEMNQEHRSRRTLTAGLNCLDAHIEVDVCSQTFLLWIRLKAFRQHTASAGYDFEFEPCPEITSLVDCVVGEQPLGTSSLDEGY